MPPVAWSAVRSKLAQHLRPLLVGVSVYDGPIVSGDAPLAYLTIAHSPCADSGEEGSFQQDVGPDGFSVTETGTILAEIGAVTGDSHVPDAFAIFAAVASWIQSDMTLGGTLGAGSTCTVSAQVVQAQTTAGAVQRLQLTVSYFTRI